MKSTTLIATGSLCLAVMACSTSADPPPGMGVAGTGGTVSSGSGGDAVVAGGTTGGTDTTGSGGTGVGGGTDPGAGAGGSAPGTSGAAGSTGGSPTGGTGGSLAMGGGPATGGGGGSAVVEPTDFGNGFDGALLQFPCGSGNPNYDCAQVTPCTGVSAGKQDAPIIKPSGNAATSWTVKGSPTVMYNVQVHIQGVVEVSWYHNGTRSAGDSSVDVASKVPGAQSYAKDLFQVGGTPLTYADQGNGFDYNQYELDVTAPGGGAKAVYFLNSVIPTENPHLSGKTQHLSFQVDELPTIKMAGGSTVSLTVRDSNCVQIQNCGTSNNGNCGTGARSITFAGEMPAPPASWNGKVTSGTGGNLNGQFIHFDITSVTAAP